MNAKKAEIGSFEITRAKVFAIFSFLILPFIYLPFFQDQDFFPKNIAISAAISLLALTLLVDKNPHRISKAALVFFVLALFFLFSTLLSYHRIVNFSEATSAFFMNALPFLLLYTILKCRGLIDFNRWSLYSCYAVLVIFIIVVGQITYGYFLDGVLNINYSIRATFSNKNFVSETLILFLPFLLAGSISNQVNRKILYRISILCTVALVLLLKTISAWLVLLVTLVLFIPVYYKFFQREGQLTKSTKTRLKYGVLILVLGLILLLVSGFFKPMLNKIDSVEKYFSTDVNSMITKADSANINSVYDRILLWNNSYKLFKEEPITGVGLSNWIVMYPKFGIGGAQHLNSGVMHFEHPHNEYLLLLSETGMLSLVAFLSLLFFALYTAGRNFRKNRDGTFYLFFCGILSFLLLSFFGYPAHRPYSVFLLVLMLALIFDGDKKQGTRWPVFLVLGISLFIFRFLIIRSSAALHVSNALTEQSKGRFGKMLKELNYFEVDRYPVDNTGTPINWYKGFAHFYLGSIDSSLYYFQKAEKQNPYHVQVLSDIGASYENKAEHEIALAYLDKALKIIPRFKEAKMNYAIAKFNLGEIDTAAEKINQVLINEGDRNETMILQTIFSSYVNKQIGQLTDSTYSKCLKELSENQSKLIKFNAECSAQDEKFAFFLKEYCERKH